MNPTQAILRRPLQDFSFYQETLKEFNFETAKELFNHTTIKNAIHLASPDMFEALDKMFYNHKEDKIVLLSFYKYLLRMSSRCTPFGLFAGCGVVHLEASESVSSFNFYTQSSLDNSLLAVLIHEIKKSNLEKLAYKVNPTVFSFYGYYRFIRSSFNDKNHKSYSIFAIKSSGLLQKIIKKVKKFSSFQELVALIASDASEQEEAKNYLLQLIACEFLITNFEISLTTAKDLSRLATIMQENGIENNEKLLNIQEKIEDLDQNWHQNEFDFKGFNQLSNIGNQEIKNKIQTDLFFKPTPFGFPKKHHKELQETIHFLQNINTTTSYNDSFTVFKENFIKRYEYHKIPLLEVLDIESGLNFGNKFGNKDAFIDQFSFPEKKTTSISMEWTTLLHVLHTKLQEAQKNDNSRIVLKTSDFKIEEKKHQYFPTYTAMVEVFKENEQEFLSLISVSQGGNNKLIGRFTLGNPDILDLAKSNHALEKELLKDYLLVEIIHLPQNRVGNVIKREQINVNEIQFLGFSKNNEENLIPLHDLSVTIKNNKVVLWSQKHQKIVLPMLSNAHNYFLNEMPIYEFLCGLTSHYLDSFHTISWGFLTNFYNYFPRVYFGNVLLLKEQWLVEKEELNHFLKHKDNSLHLFIQKRKIKPLIQWVNGDQTMLIDLSNDFGQELFQQIVTKQNKCIFEEFIFSESLHKGDGYSNQLLIFGKC